MARRGNPPTRSRRRSSGSRLAVTLLSTGLLVVAGFAVGLLAGALWETPEKILGPFRGQAQEVPLDVLASPTGTTEAPHGEVEVAAAVRPARPQTAPTPAPGPAAAALAPAERAQEPAAVSAPPPEETGPFAIQVGSFTEPVPAWKLAEQLGEKQYEVYVNEGDAAGKARWRVRVGPVRTRSEAERLADRLKASEGLPTWILPAEERG